MTNIESESRPVVDEKPNFLTSFKRRMSRRTLVRGAAKGALVVGIAAAIGEARYDPLDVNKNSEESNETVFDRLFAGIDSIQDPEERKQTLEKAKELRTIMDVNDRFVKAYEEDRDESGQPKLKQMYSKKYKSLEVEDAEKMIFIANNNEHAKKMIMKPLSTLIENRGNIVDAVSHIRQDVENFDQEEGEQVYVGGRHISLKDYLEAGTIKGGELQIGPGNEVDSDEARAALDKDIAEVRETLQKIPNIEGIVKLWNEKYGAGNKYGGKGAGNFIELGDNSEVNLSTIDKFLIFHEIAGHGLDVVLNDTQLIKYLGPEEFYKIFAKREECLSDENWGRSYPDLKRVFSKKVSFIPPIQTEDSFGPPGPDTVSRDAFNIQADITTLQSGLPEEIESVRVNNDNYPDGIFCTGIYIDQPVTSDGNIFFQRRQDEDVIAEYRKMFNQKDSTSYTLKKFLGNEENATLLRVVAEKSPWLGKVFQNLESLSDVLDSRMLWLEIWDRSEKLSALSKPILEVPHMGDKDSEWFDFCVGLGQRLAVINMIHEGSSDLDLLSSDQRRDISDQLKSSLNSADKEMFANMMAASQTKEFNTPNPYLEYLGMVSDAMLANSITVKPSEELMASVKRTSVRVGYA